MKRFEFRLLKWTTFQEIQSLRWTLNSLKVLFLLFDYKASLRRLRFNVIQNYFLFLFVHREFLRSNIRIKSFMSYMWCVETWSQQKVFFAQKSNKRSQKAKRRRNWNSKLLFPASSRHSIGVVQSNVENAARSPSNELDMTGRKEDEPQQKAEMTKRIKRKIMHPSSETFPSLLDLCSDPTEWFFIILESLKFMCEERIN